MNREKGGWIYFLSNRPNGTLYVGVTNDLVRRVGAHKEGLAAGFTRRYHLKRLVYSERYDDIATAIQRETNIERWPREWKINFITKDNPGWNDLCQKFL